ncbi:MAG: S8 family serine peptidase [Dehalococcoidia bacterium]
MRRTRWRRGPALSAISAVSVALALTWGAAVAAPAAATERVELTRTGDAAAAAGLLRAIHAEVEVTSGDRIQARVPPAALPGLRRASRLVRLESPGVFVPLQVLSASNLVGADAWLQGGLTGRGTKVAILDTGFAGYKDVLGSTLPAQVTARSFRADGAIEGSGDHGRRAAEIIHSVAPGAELYLVSFSTVTEMSAAVDYLIAQGVDVVSFSIGYIHNGPGDGTGGVDGVVSRSTGAGMAWAVASGNWAQQHWAGTFRDDNRDAINEFRPGVQQLAHPFNVGDLITLSLRWDDNWGSACADYDVELFSPGGALIRASRGLQECSGNPVEALQVLATETGNYYARVIRGNSAPARRLDVIFVGSPDRGQGVDAPVSGASLGAPADHPHVVTVGALTNALVRSEAPYSSRGPTADGRPKPEIIAPTGVSMPGSETFSGTSAAAPHVAAAMALLREAIPGIDRAHLTAELQSRAIALPAVQDGTPGARRLDLTSTAGIGPLLPPDADRAMLEGTVSPGASVATVRYDGPPGYPLRFIYRLTGDRDVAGAWVLDRPTGTWRGFVTGAPAATAGVDRVSEGDTIVLIFR